MDCAPYKRVDNTDRSVCPCISNEPFCSSNGLTLSSNPDTLPLCSLICSVLKNALIILASIFIVVLPLSNPEFNSGAKTGITHSSCGNPELYTSVCGLHSIIKQTVIRTKTYLLTTTKFIMSGLSTVAYDLKMKLYDTLGHLDKADLCRSCNCGSELEQPVGPALVEKVANCRCARCKCTMRIPPPS